MTDGYVVVVFGDNAGHWCTLSQCPQGIASWFPTSEDAYTYCETVPEGFQPHVLQVEKGEIVSL